MPIEYPSYQYQPDLFTQDEVENEEGVNNPAEARRKSELAKMALGNLKELPEWYEEYLKLTNRGWPWRVAAYIAWAATPKVNRWPRTQAELATDVLGLGSDRQIIKWKVRTAVMEMVSKLQVAPMLKHRADVIEALISSASDPDYKGHQDRKLYLEITGDYIPSSKLDAILNHSAGSGVQGKSTEDLEAEAGYADEG